MKKFNLIIFSLFACLAAANAQIEGDGGDDGFGQKPTTTTSTPRSSAGKTLPVGSKHYSYELSIGPRLGVGHTSMSEGDGLKFTDGGGINFCGGLAANIRFGGINSKDQYLDGQGVFGVDLEFNYKSLSVKTLGNDDLKMSYFEVPIMLQLYPCYNTKQLKNLYFEVGPTIAGTLSSSPESVKINNTTYKTVDFKGFDVKATVGIGYRFNKTSANDGFYVNARYYLGTSELAGNFPGKLSSAEISIGYLFKCIGTKKEVINIKN